MDTISWSDVEVLTVSDLRASPVGGLNAGEIEQCVVVDSSASPERVLEP